MLRLFLQRFVALVAFALAICLPFQASAAILAVCDDDALTRAPAPAVALPPESTHGPGHDPSCEVLAGVDEDSGEINAAPLCDQRGVSITAPPRIYPIADARIEAAPGCGDAELSPAIGPGPQDPSHSAQSLATPPPAVLVPELALPPPPGAEAAPPPHIAGGPRRGFDRGIDHPPR